MDYHFTVMMYRLSQFGISGMHLVFALFIIACLPGYIAHTKGHSFLKWWIYGVLLFVVALPGSLLLQKRQRVLDEREMSNGDYKKCAGCAELIRSEAEFCRFCGSNQRF